MSDHSFLSRLPLRAARWSATHPWRAIGGWFFFVLVAAAMAFVVPTQQTSDADYRLGESGRADALVAAGSFPGGQVESVLITAGDGGRLDPTEVRAASRDLRSRVASLPGVRRVTDATWNPERTAALVDVQVTDAVDDATPVQRATAAVAAAHPELSLREAGDISVNTAINDRVAQDLHSAEGISLPITLLLMVVAFGAVIAAGVPVLLAVTSVGATMGIAAPLSHLIHAESTVTSMIVLIGMAVGVDYSLFYLKREREERAAGRTTLDAVEIAAATSGHSILVSGAAVVASMAGLFLVGGATFDSLAAGAIVVVVISVIGSVTVLPALLVTLGSRADRPRVPLLWRLNRRIGAGGLSRRILAPVVSHPVAALTVAVVAVGALAAPALGMKIHDSGLQTLPASIPQVQTLRQMAEEFPAQGTTATVVVHGTTAEQPAILGALHGLTTTAAGTASFDAAGRDAIQTSPDRQTVQLSLPIPWSAADPRSEQAITDLRDHLLPDALSGLSVQHAVGGEVATSMDFASRQQSRIPLVIGFVLLLTLV
ncbi:MAG: MMPL family transporter, partial [Nocardioidaceae bacterium]